MPSHAPLVGTASEERNTARLAEAPATTSAPLTVSLDPGATATSTPDCTVSVTPTGTVTLLTMLHELPVASVVFDASVPLSRLPPPTGFPFASRNGEKSTIAYVTTSALSRIHAAIWTGSVEPQSLSS